MYWPTRRACPAQREKSGPCFSSRRSAWPVCRVKPSFPNLKADSSFDSAMQKLIQTSMTRAGGLRDLLRNWHQVFRQVSISLDRLSARSPKW